MKRRGNSFLKNGFRAGRSTHIALGLGLIILGPAVVSLAGRLLRPAASALAKGGLAVYQEAMKIISEAREATPNPVQESGTEGPVTQAAPAYQAQPHSGISGARADDTAEPVSAPGDNKPAQKEPPKPWIVRGY